jgi:hypothetical protein
MKLDHVSTVNGALENDLLTQINNIIARIHHLESQLQAL